MSEIRRNIAFMDDELEKEQAFFMRQSQEMQPFCSRVVATTQEQPLLVHETSRVLREEDTLS